jgi:hypothetical protein
MMSETGTKDWKVLDFRVGKTEPNPHGGNFQKFFVDFEGSPDTYWRRREGDSPEKGNSYYGTISKNDYGPKFKKEKAPDQGGAAAKRDWQPESQRDPERSVRILRQHSQTAALQFLAMTRFPVEPENRMVALEQIVKPFIDWFDADVNQAGQTAIQASGKATAGSEGAKTPSTAHSPASGQRSAESQFEEEKGERHQWLCQLLEDAGLDATGAHALGSFMVGRFNPEQIKKAETGLQDIESQQDTLSRLRTAYEKATGTLLPVPSDDPQIPF